MINIKHIVCNMLQENCYIVSDESREAIVIDCGAYYESERQMIIKYINDKQLALRHVICTHAHFDHCFGNATLWRQYQICPSLPLGDKEIADIDIQMRMMMGTGYNEEQAPVSFYDINDSFKFGSHCLTVIATPGHSPGSCCLYCAEERMLFTGDTLFCQSIGRTDLEGGNWADMQKSLQILAQMPIDTCILPGHGPQTTIDHELQSNPYLAV